MAETTFSSPDNFIILTPCVFLPAILISFTWASYNSTFVGRQYYFIFIFTIKVDVTLPFLEELIIPIIPLPPLFVTLKS